MTLKKVFFSIGILGFAVMAMSDPYKQHTINDLPVDSITPLKSLPAVIKKINPSAWPKHCPVTINNLAYVKLHYWGFDDKAHVGAIIVNKAVAHDVLAIFVELYQNKFPIEQMQPVYEYQNDDDASMAANNTSAFNCREVTGQSGIFSQHSYGRAIDINPKINPYVTKTQVLPASSEQFVDRNKAEKGKITHASLPYQLFIQRGWHWGGDWHDLQDYQHFEKRENGEIRDPHGYAPHSPA